MINILYILLLTWRFVLYIKRQQSPQSINEFGCDFILFYLRNENKKDQLSLFEKYLYSYYDLIAKKKEFYCFAIKSKTWFYVCVCGRWRPPRGHVIYIYVHFNLFLITVVIKKKKKLWKIYRNKNKRLHLFLQINISFVSRK